MQRMIKNKITRQKINKIVLNNSKTNKIKISHPKFKKNFKLKLKNKLEI